MIKNLFYYLKSIKIKGKKIQESNKDYGNNFLNKMNTCLKDISVIKCSDIKLCVFSIGYNTLENRQEVISFN